MRKKRRMTDGQTLERRIKAKPFEVQSRDAVAWGTIPGAYYKTRAEANMVRDQMTKRLPKITKRKYRSVDARKAK